MFKKRKNLKGGIVLTSGSVTAAASSLLRNVIIARLITVEDFGIAATFALTIAMVEMASNLAIDRIIVQARDGGEDKVVATAHSIQLIQGAFSTTILYFLAGPIALVFSIPEVTPAFQLLAIVPFVRAFANLDRFRFQREMRFGPSVWVDTGSHAAATLLALPFGYWLGDYWAMLYVLIAHAVLMMIVSHVVAERRFKLGWDREIVKRILSFTWPLLLNGGLLFGVFQGDRAIVGISLGMEELGWFSAAFAMTFVPTRVIAKVGQSFFLPILASLQDDAEAFNRMAMIVLQVVLVGAIIIAVGFVVAGPALLELIFGADFRRGAEIIGLLGIMQGLRVLRTGPAVVAIAKAQTRNPMYANLTRFLFLSLGLVAVWQDLGVVGIIAAALIGEGFALLTALALVHRYTHVPLLQFLIPAVLAAGITTLAGLTADRFFGPDDVALPIVMGTLSAAVAAIILLAIMKDARDWVLGKGRPAE